MSKKRAAKSPKECCITEVNKSIQWQEMGAELRPDR